MNGLPDGFEKMICDVLPAKERAAFFHALFMGAGERGIRFRRGAAPDQVFSGDRIPWALDAHYIKEGTRPGLSPLHDAGAYYLQEPSAMAPVMALDVRPGQRVLDLCAAPGGKSTQISSLLAGQGVLVANEFVPERAKILAQNLERMGAMNAIVTNAPPDTLAARWGAWFDRVLVDAPCSGEGMFRREPDSRLEWSEKTPEGCAKRQRAILESAAGLVRPGGLIVYSTCTFNKVENECMIGDFLRDHVEFAPEDFALEGVGDSASGCLRLWPHRLRGEGHFVARLRKKGEEEAEAREAPMIDLSEIVPGIAEYVMRGMRHDAGDHTWILPPEYPPLAGIRALSTGLCVMVRRGRTELPHHAISHALPVSAFAQVFSADEEQAMRYLAGETIAAEGFEKGFVLVEHGGLGLGLAKYSDGMLKNHLPKGLRRR